MYRFIDHSIRPNFQLDDLSKELLDKAFYANRTVIILRGSMFFCATQEITLSKLREYFTDHAISKLIGDGFIKFKENE
jgi:hypothetical protein